MKGLYLRVLARRKGFEPLQSLSLRGLLRSLIRFAQKMLRILGQGGDPLAGIIKTRSPTCRWSFLFWHAMGRSI